MDRPDEVLEANADGVKLSNAYVQALSLKISDLSHYLYELHQARTTDKKIHYYNLACNVVSDFQSQYLFTMAKYGNHAK